MDPVAEIVGADDPVDRAAAVVGQPRLQCRLVEMIAVEDVEGAQRRTRIEGEGAALMLLAGDAGEGDAAQILLQLQPAADLIGMQEGQDVGVEGIEVWPLPQTRKSNV